MPDSGGSAFTLNILENDLSDFVRRFLIENTQVRGEFARLDDSWQAMQAGTDMPPGVRLLLGQACAGAVLLAATIKFDGRLTVQVSSSGPLRLLLVQASSDGALRATARWDEDIPAGTDLGELCPEGYLMISVDTGKGEPYQGLVSLPGPTLAAAFDEYFAVSDQLPTRFWLASDERRAAGLLLQRLPAEAGEVGDADDWDRCHLRAATVSGEELLTLRAETLVRRLFAGDDVRLYAPQPVFFRCDCSRERVGAMLRALANAELEELVDDALGGISVACEFCATAYLFDVLDLRQLEDADSVATPSRTRH